MKEYSLKIERYIDKDVNPRDKVKLIDGSGLTRVDSNYRDPKEDVYITCCYPELTGLSDNLMDIECVVLETGIEDYVSDDCFGVTFLQDIVVQCGSVKFRTCSKFVKKIDNKIDLLRIELNKAEMEVQRIKTKIAKEEAEIDLSEILYRPFRGFKGGYDPFIVYPPNFKGL